MICFMNITIDKCIYFMISIYILFVLFVSCRKMQCYRKLSVKFIHNRIITKLMSNVPPSLQKITSVLSEDGILDSREVEKAQVKIYNSEALLCKGDALSYMKSQSKFPKSPLLDSKLFVKYIRKSAHEKFKTDSVFANMVNVREIRRNHSTILNSVESKLFHCKEELLAHPNFPELALLDKDIIGGRQAITSMEKLLALNVESTDESRNLGHNRKFTDEQIRRIRDDLLPQKLSETKRKLLRRDELRMETSPFQLYQQALQELDQLYENIGLIKAMETSQVSQSGVGNKRQSSGKGFEESAFQVVEDYLIPSLAKKYCLDTQDIFIMTNVKFGIATSKGSTGEFDCIVCTKIPTPIRFHSAKARGSFCKVLAVIEVKRNPDDIGEAFISYQRSLAWLGGVQSTYTNEEWKTKTHPSGHFAERPFLIVSDGEPMLFSIESFAHLTRRIVETEYLEDMDTFLVPSNIHSHVGTDVGLNASVLQSCNNSNKLKYELFIDDLYFVTKPNSIEGVTSKSASWLLNRVGSNEIYDMELSNETTLEELRLSSLERYPHRLSTMELLDIYSKSHLVNQLYLIGK